jgi:hypothetical protein
MWQLGQFFREMVTLLFMHQIERSGLQEPMESELHALYYRTMGISFYIGQTEVQHGTLALQSHHQHHQD